MKARKHGDSQEHRHLATFAADCAEHVLPFFGKTRPQDDRPRKDYRGGARVGAW